MFSKSRPVKKTGTGDREWLYEEVLKFIGRQSEWEIRLGREVQPKADREIWQHFCGMHGSNTGRKSWDSKNRTTKRAMLRSTLKRLLADGRIKIVVEEDLNIKSMHGMERRNLDHRQRMFGKEYDGKVRTYARINVLEGMVQALEAPE